MNKKLTCLQGKQGLCELKKVCIINATVDPSGYKRPLGENGFPLEAACSYSKDEKQGMSLVDNNDIIHNHN